jgi:processive 1,2-diacylglycerol beta-glucosyltransferase
VLLVSAGVGAGHNQAARAIMAGLAQADPSLPVEWLDVLTITSRAFTLYYAGGYNLLVTRLPWLYGFGYWLTDRPHGPRRGLLERRRLWSERRSLGPLARWLGERLPALVVNTHFVSQPMVTHLIGRGTPGLRQMTVVTDYHAHRWWCAQRVDRFFVPDEFGRQRLIDFGTPAESVELTGLPVHPKWRQPLEEAEIRGRWKLPAGRPVVLVAGGVSFAVGGIADMAQELCRRLGQAFVVVLAGQNKQLMGRLAAMPEAQGDNAALRIVSFTDRIHELVQLSSVFLTKSGGMTVSEATTKGTPLVLMRPVPGQEAYNARMMVDSGAAVQANTQQEAVELVVALLNDPARLQQLADNARRLDRPATTMICEKILEAVAKMGSPV